MGKIGYFLIIFGIIILISFGVYMIITDISMPLIIKIPLILMIVGSICIIISKIIEKSREREEENDSSKY